MKKLLSRFLVLVLALPIYVSASDDAVMAENLRIAKTFCLKNTECADVIALELDDSFRKGVNDQDSKRPWNVLVNKQTKTLATLCEKAPKGDLCERYRTKLIERYMAGLSHQ